MKERVLKAGTFVMMSCGEYSDFYVRFLAITKVDINIDETLEKYLTEHPKQRAKYRFDEGKFDAWLLKNGYIEEVDCFEWHTGSYGKAGGDLYPRNKD